MVQACHVCGSSVAKNGATPEELDEAFVCHDCGEVTCDGCKSIGVALETDHCQRCRG